jgi:hypothetical protein
MKRLLTFAVLGVLLGGLSGCHICECWHEAWNSRTAAPCAQQRPAVVVAQPCVVTDSCCSPCASPCASPCGSPCTSCGTPAPVITPGVVPAR